jgi:hypothetical protein
VPRFHHPIGETSAAPGHAPRVAAAPQRAVPLRHPEPVLQRAMAAPHSLRPPDLLAMQRTLGNNAAGAMLGRAPVQTKLTINAPGDRWEREADRIAKQVAQQLDAPEVVHAFGASQTASHPEPMLRRENLPEDEEVLQKKSPPSNRDATKGGEASADLTSAIDRARGSGQPLDASLQRTIGQAMGADFRGVRIHTDAQADLLNRAISSTAFTTREDMSSGMPHISREVERARS